MRARAAQLRAFKGFSRSVIVEPVEAIYDRVGPVVALQPTKRSSRIGNEPEATKESDATSEDARCEN